MAGEVRLGEVAEIIMGQSPPGETYNERGVGLPFFQGVADFNYRHPTPRVFCSAPSRIAFPGDILVSVRAPIGRVNVADRKCAIGRGLSIIRPRVSEDARYIEFALRLEEPKWQAIEGSGSVFGNATRHDLEALRLPWPEARNERRAIAQILGTLDDKFELNRRMSETLEAMARALFKSWFVEFEPVRAKMEGRWKRHSPLPANEGPVERSTPLPLGEGKGEGKKHLPSDLLDFARELRKIATDAERLLWRLLRNRALEGAKFRRQHPVPPYVLDFYCHELKLAIEVDGGQHNEPPRKKRDEERTAFLESHGIRVLRFWNREVLHETEGVLEAIYQAIVERRQEVLPSPPTPLPEGEGGYLPAHLYDLFPDRLVDSELGEIPEGWMSDKTSAMHVDAASKEESYQSARAFKTAIRRWSH
ncbi:MAG: hypothetical protein KatS3mg015_1222 [Fimbriimonadales bacterium]|nr:MAG: hypothetical protein KatS3mg015_1222 [Fimbriimonadales bacterium]